MAYNKLTQKDLEALQKIVGQERFCAGEDINPDYSHDELGGVARLPEVLVKVKTTDEVSAVMRLAYEKNIPVTVRGAGTGLVGGATPVEGGILLDTSLMNKIIELDKENLTITAQAGVLLMELAAFTQENDFLYPPDPGEKSATIGGNISTNAGGMRAVKYGVTRDYVRGLTVVLPDGSIQKLGGKIVKNCSGYGLKDLIIGSEGTLAIITEAVLKLLPLPAVSVSLLVPFDSMEAALDIVPQIILSKANPTAIEYMSRETILFAEDFLGKKFPDTRYPAYILLTFDGNDKTSVEKDYSKVADLCLASGAADAYIVDTDDRKQTVWNARGAFLEAIKASAGEMDECDVVVPRNKIAGYIRFTHALAKEEGLRLPSFGHAGDGNLHIYLCKDNLEEKEWRERMTVVFEKLYKKAAEMGGLVSGEHGIGWAKKEYLFEQCGPRQIEIMRQIKAAFDPKNILNPGKVCQ